jgi:hypothetical protein
VLLFLGLDPHQLDRYSVGGDNTTCVQTQTADINPSTDETMQTDQHNSDAQAINIPTVLTEKRERSTDKMQIYWYAPISKKTLILKIPAKNGRFICRGVDVVCLCLNTRFVVTNGSLFAFHWSMHWAFLLLVEGERCFLFWARLVISPVFFNGLSSDAQAINMPTVLTEKRERSTDKMQIYWYAPISKKTLILKIRAKHGKAVQLCEVRTTE